MHSTGQNAAKHNPEQRNRPEQTAGYSPHHRPQPGDIQQLNQKDAPGRQRHIVNPIGHGDTRHRLALIESIHALRQPSIKHIAENQQNQAKKECYTTCHLIKKINRRDSTPDGYEIQADCMTTRGDSS